MAHQDFHRGHVKAVGVCPLCGEIITRTYQVDMETGNELVYGIGGVRGVTQRHAPTIRVKWMCAGGCDIEVKGAYPAGRELDFFGSSDEPKAPEPEPLTGESLRELSPMAERAKHALDELGEGIDHGTKGERRNDVEPGRPSGSERER
ncbi:MAG: hypothetical protein WC565_01990 [Parcubacteria group bacterium]